VGKALITGKTLIGEAVEKHPATVAVLLKHGFHCVGCHVAAYESIDAGAAAHGLGEKEIRKLLADLNRAAAKK
jgi:hybrid cluster-associated redox disulfide protein